jgi:hypothetical protein
MAEFGISGDQWADGACSLLPSPEQVKAASDRAWLEAVWASVVKRCTDPTSRAYAANGERGITVGFRGYDEFEAWSEANGYAGHADLRRVDPDGPFSPANCYWAG